MLTAFFCAFPFGGRLMVIWRVWPPSLGFRRGRPKRYELEDEEPPCCG